MKYSSVAFALFGAATAATAKTVDAIYNSTSIDVVNDMKTTLLTITSCKDNACSEHVTSTGYYVQTVTETGVVTHTTVYCPLTSETPAPAPAPAPTVYSNSTIASSTYVPPPPPPAPTSVELSSTLDAVASTLASEVFTPESSSTYAAASSEISTSAGIVNATNGAFRLGAASGAMIGLGAMLLL